MEDIHEQLGVSKSFLNDTFAMIRIAKDGEVWVQCIRPMNPRGDIANV
ncbi:TPA: hypothetical protein RQK80_004847 [Vibrio vulnificus]|nr:hypothetical protein [Vibrio vulnificus]